MALVRQPGAGETSVLIILVTMNGWLSSANRLSASVIAQRRDPSIRPAPTAGMSRHMFNVARTTWAATSWSSIAVMLRRSAMRMKSPRRLRP